MKRLRIAVTKGRLLEDSLDLFEKMGLDCTQVRADTRKLILPIANYPMDVVLSKAADVLTYVTHGVCDLGIVGSRQKGADGYEYQGNDGTMGTPESQPVCCSEQ